MENKNQTALDLLWFGKNGNIFESLLFALFLFLFSFALATAPDAIQPGAHQIFAAADGIGRGYEAVIHRLDRNVVVMPAIASQTNHDLAVRISRMQDKNQLAVQNLSARIGWEGSWPMRPPH